MQGSSGTIDTAGRIDWVDYAKGLCIVFVVMMHSTLGVEAATGATGWLHPLVEFARPFRMPDFFLISGLFLAQVIDRPWRQYLDRKVVHFAYFYLLWMTIQFAFKSPGIAMASGASEVVRLYLVSLIEPFGTLWFIYLLPIFFVVVKLTRRVPPILIWAFGAALEMAQFHTGWTVIDEFANRFVYFYTGYVLAPFIFALARQAQERAGLALAGLTAWAIVNGVAVFTGVATLPLLSLALGFVGAGAIITVSSLMARTNLFEALRYCGRNSIVIYLAFFLPMAISREVLIRSGLFDVGTMSVLVTTAGVVGALMIFWAVRRTPARFLFERPLAFHMSAPKAKPVLQAAE